MVPLEMMLGIIVGPDPSEMMMVQSPVAVLVAWSVTVSERLYSLGCLAWWRSVTLRCIPLT